MQTVRDYIDRQAEARPDEPYLIAPETGRRLTYRQLKSDAERLARRLHELGLRKGDKVTLMLHNGYQTADLLLGVMYAGFVVSPINLLAQPSQLEYVLGHSDTQLVFVAAEYRARLEAALTKVSRPVYVFVIDPDAPSIFEGEGLRDAAPAPVYEEDDALLMYTSGTTGVPKGVVLTHRNVVAGGEYTSEAHRLTSRDRVLCALPLYHINGQIVTAVGPLVHGGSVVMPHRFSVSNFWELVSEHRCTWINVVPTIISYLLNSTDPRAPERKLHLEQVRFGRSASAPLAPSLHKEFEHKFGISVIETMGLTETAAPAFANPLDASQRKYGSPGKPFGNVARIVSVETGETLPPNQAGEIMIRGDNVMKGYYKAAQITAKTLEPDGWLHTGDLGYCDEDGFFFVTGRLKELIIKGGENIAPREIDEALLKHPAILEAAAVGIPDRDYGQEIMACVVLKPDYECSEQELREFCRTELGRYKTPKLIRFVDTLPKGPSGKVQRLKLLESTRTAE
ncbi:MAG TPA: AMP-binding protein [Casimicrobiaceae bacterium]|nr:AMP-binding protein [Casimicrobiaceae bacterium]